MSLLSIINLSAQALNANQLGVRVVANNIANANTPGYIRESLNLTPAPSQRIGNLNLGLGVQVQGVEQHINQFVAARLREAKSDLQAGAQERDVLGELESVLGELSDTDLSTGLSRFFSSIHDIVNQPESVGVRNVATLEAVRLTTDIRSIDGQLRTLRSRVNDEIRDGVADVNRLLKEISQLNVSILEAEGGLTSSSTAVGLRDQRYMALQNLAELIDVRVAQQESGTVSVYAGGEYLVFEGTHRTFEIETKADRGLMTNHLVLSDTGGKVDFTTGRLGGLLTSRDQVLASAIDRFDEFARSLAYEFNRVFSSSQGLEGYTLLTSTNRVTSITAALDDAGLAYSPENGSFTIQVRDIATGQTKSTEIPVSLQGLDDDTTLESLRDAIDAVDGVSASIDSNRRLTIKRERDGIDFAFGDDSSGVLAAVGIATFFSGSGAGDISVSQAVRNNPKLFAASQSGIGMDSLSAEALAALGDQRIESQGGLSITQVYERLTIEITQASAASSAEVRGLTVFHNTIEAEHLSITGVSLDEEAIKLLTYQRAFQASARVIQTASDLLDILVNL